MALTSREQKIMYLAFGAVVLLILNAYVLDPIIEKRNQASDECLALESQVEQYETTLGRKESIQRHWDDMQQAGLGDDIQKAETMIYRFLEDCSSSSRMQLDSIQPERVISDSELGTINFVLSGTGSMNSVTRFLWNLETANVPLKVKSYQLGSKNDTGQEMTVQVELSTIYIQDQSKQAKGS